MQGIGRWPEGEERGDARITGDAHGEEFLGTSEDRTDGPGVYGVADPPG